jgi:hypothetical protein
MSGPKADEAIGPSPVDRARPGSKHHLLTDGNGIPLAVTLTGGNRNDVTQLIPLALELKRRISAGASVSLPVLAHIARAGQGPGTGRGQ